MSRTKRSERDPPTTPRDALTIRIPRSDENPVKATLDNNTISCNNPILIPSIVI